MSDPRPKFVCKKCGRYRRLYLSFGGQPVGVECKALESEYLSASLIEFSKDFLVSSFRPQHHVLSKRINSHHKSVTLL